MSNAGRQPRAGGRSVGDHSGTFGTRADLKRRHPPPEQLHEGRSGGWGKRDLHSAICFVSQSKRWRVRPFELICPGAGRDRRLVLTRRSLNALQSPPCRRPPTPAPGRRPCRPGRRQAHVAGPRQDPAARRGATAGSWDPKANTPWTAWTRRDGGWRPYPKKTSRSGSSNWNGSSAQKLKDGVPSARQVCRTDFVIHLSVAFDDLTWNAKAADDLFKRAQTMPASEAKVWKEVFEAVLKKEIGQTDTADPCRGAGVGGSPRPHPGRRPSRGAEVQRRARPEVSGPPEATDRGGRRPLEGPGGPIRGHPPRRRGQPHPAGRLLRQGTVPAGQVQGRGRGGQVESPLSHEAPATAVDPLDLLGPPEGCTG